jgi:hypothetical protein
MTVHERDIAAAIDPVTLGRLAEAAMQAPSDGRISRFGARRTDRGRILPILPENASNE